MNEAQRACSAPRLHAQAALMPTMMLLACVSCADDGSNMVTVKLTNAPSAIVAYREGSGAWTATTATRGELRFTAPSGTYSLAIACDIEGNRQVRAYELTTAELSTIEYEVECGAATQMISGTFANPSPLGAFVFWGPQTFDGGQDSYAFAAPRGTADLLATDRGRVVLKRGLTLGQAPLVVDIDFNDPAAMEITSFQLGVSPFARSEKLSVTTSLLTSGGTYTSFPLCESSLTIACGVRSGLAQGDLHIVWAAVSPQSGYGSYRAARWTAREVSDHALSMANAPSSGPTVTATSRDGHLSIAAQWPTRPHAPLYRVIASQNLQTSGSLSWELFVSEARLSNGLDLELPDLIGVTGWDTAFDLIATQYTNWWVEARDGVALDEMLRRFPTQEGVMVTDGWMGAVAPSP